MNCLWWERAFGIRTTEERGRLCCSCCAEHWLTCFLFKISGLPDEKGRFQILHIHTVRMREHQLLAEDVDIAELAVETKNFSGAELEGLVRAAQSTAMNRHIKVSPVISHCGKKGKIITFGIFSWMFTFKWVMASQHILGDEIHMDTTFSLCFYMVLNYLFHLLTSKLLLRSSVGMESDCL